MTFAKLLAMGKSLYTKYSATDRRTQEELGRCFREFSRTGAIPLGYRWADSHGRRVAWWLVFDQTRYRSDADLEQALRENSPPGAALKIIRI